jgi:hypothetical protein
MRGFGFVRFDGESDKGSTTKAPRTKSAPPRRHEDVSLFRLLNFEDSNGISPAHSARRWENIDRSEESEWATAPNTSDPTEWPALQSTAHNGGRQRHTRQEPSNQVLKSLPIKQLSGSLSNQRQLKNRNDEFSSNDSRAPQAQSFDPFTSAPNENTPWHAEVNAKTGRPGKQSDNSANHRSSSLIHMSMAQDLHNQHTAYRQQYAIEEPGTENVWPQVVDVSGGETRKEDRIDIGATGSSKRPHTNHDVESSHGAWSQFGPVEKNPGGGGTKDPNIDGHDTFEHHTRPGFSQAIAQDYRVNHRSFHGESINVPDILIADGMALRPGFSQAIAQDYRVNHRSFHGESINVPDILIADGMASVYSELTMDRINNNELIPDTTPESEAPIHHSNRYKLPAGGRYATDEMAVRSDKGKKIAAVSARLGAQPRNAEPLPQTDESGIPGGQEQERSQSEHEAEPSIKSAPKSIPPQRMSNDSGKSSGDFYTRRNERLVSTGSNLKEQQPEFIDLEIAESASFPDRERPIEFFRSQNDVEVTEDTYADDIFLSFAQLDKSKPQENAIFSDEPLDIENNEHELLSPMFFSKTPCAAALQSFNGQSHISTSTPPKNSRPSALEILPAVEQKTQCRSKLSVSKETKTGEATEETPDTGMLSQSPVYTIPDKKLGMLQQFVKMAAPILSRGVISMAQEEPIRRAAETLGIPLMGVADEEEEEIPIEMVEFPSTCEHETKDFTSSIRDAAVKIRNSKKDQNNASIEGEYDPARTRTLTGDYEQVSATASALSAMSQLMYPIEAMESLLDSASEIGDDRSNPLPSLDSLNSNQRGAKTDDAQVTQKSPKDSSLPSTTKEDPHEKDTPLVSKKDEASKSAPFGIESSKHALPEDKALEPSDSRDPPSQTTTERSRLEPEASRIAALTIAYHGSETSKKEPPSTSNQKTVIRETNDPTSTSQEGEQRDVLTAIESLPLGATVEEIGLLNRFLKVVGPAFNGNELSLTERERIHDAALRQNIPETFLNQMLDQSVGIRRWEDKSVYSTLGRTRKHRRHQHKLADPHSPGASTYCTRKSNRTKTTTSSHSTRRTAYTARTGFSSLSNSTGCDSLSPTSEAGFGCGLKHFWSDLTGQDTMPDLSGAVSSQDSESIFSDDMSWETGKRTAGPFCSADYKR